MTRSAFIQLFLLSNLTSLVFAENRPLTETTALDPVRLDYETKIGILHSEPTVQGVPTHQP